MTQFKQSPVIFDEQEHKYMLDDKRLLGITGLIHSILGLGVYPDANDYTKDFVIPRAGSRGTAIHHAIQTYDLMGFYQALQTVHTKFGSETCGNVRYEDLEWDVHQELDNYIFHRDNGGFKALANELTVSDNNKWASQIDNVWENRKTGGIWLVDTKSNNIGLYPKCGYYKDDYFTSGEDALKEYLSWQLSIYAELFEAENPGYIVEGLACNWLRKDESAFWVIERKPSHLVQELLKTEYIITDLGPAYFHPDPSVFGVGNNLPEVKQEQSPVLPQNVINYIARLIKTEAETKAKLDEAKKSLRQAMEEHGVKSWDSGYFKATIAVDSVRKTFDSTAFKKDHPDLYNAYIVEKTTKGSFTLKATNND